MPSIGKTHGVRLSSSPPTNSARNQPSPPCASSAASLPSGEVTFAAPGGAAVAKPALAEGVLSAGAIAVPVGGAPTPVVAAAPGAAADTFTVTSNGTFAGARQTWS